VHARAAKLQQAAAAIAQRGQVIFAVAVEAPEFGRALARQQAVDADDMVERGGIAAGVDQHQMVIDRVELVAFQPLRVIDQRPVAAKLFDEDAIAQALRGQQVALLDRQADHEGRGFGRRRIGRHGTFLRGARRVIGPAPGRWRGCRRAGTDLQPCPQPSPHRPPAPGLVDTRQSCASVSAYSLG